MYNFKLFGTFEVHSLAQNSLNFQASRKFNLYIANIQLMVCKDNARHKK